MIPKSVVYVVQVRAGMRDAWVDYRSIEDQAESTRVAEGLLDLSEPGAYDGKLRVVRRTVIEETVLRVHRTMFFPKDEPNDPRDESTEKVD